MSWSTGLTSGSTGGSRRHPDPDAVPQHPAPGDDVPFYTGIAELPAETLLACWAGEPRLEDSRLGSVAGVADFRDYLKATREWLSLSDAVADAVTLVSAASRGVEEVRWSSRWAGTASSSGRRW